ncbi:MAG: hypothetical protein M3R36_19490 [Bacteroidota bacterium]|nr:hypothetical protein [Bacteroidota bacterium]
MENIIKKIFFTVLVLTALYRVTFYSQSSALGINYQIPENDKDMVYKDFKVYQNEPLEFSEVTNIKFDIYKAGEINLSIFDIGGNLIENLVDGDMEPGQYSVYFKAYEGLTPGEYFYVMKVDGLTKVMRMLYSKI